jgi:hypothetical protein
MDRPRSGPGFEQQSALGPSVSNRSVIDPVSIKNRNGDDPQSAIDLG